MVDIVRRDANGAILDIRVPAFTAGDFDAEGVVLIFLGEIGDAPRHGRREQQRTTALRRGLEDELHVLAKAHVEHLVGFIQNDRLELRDIEAIAAEVVAQTARRADDNMRTGSECTLLGARIHTADTGNDAGASLGIEPGQFAMHLQRKLARRRDDQGQRRSRAWQAFFAFEQIGRNGEAIGDGLAGASLCGDQKVAADGVIGQHGGLNGGGFAVVALSQCAGERRRRRLKRHGL